MTIEITCQCGRVLKAPDSAIGRKGRCKGCSREVEILQPVADEPEVVDDEPIPDLAIDTSDAEEDDARPDPRFAPPAPKPTASMPPEPWFYRFLEIYARLCILFAFVQFILSLYLLLRDLDDIQSLTGANRIGLIVSFVAMIGVTLVSCPILLAVDVARNIRAMRYGVH
jgi:hypothetical protein